MRSSKHLLCLALASAIVAPGAAIAKGRSYAALSQKMAATGSPCGRHVVEVLAGAVFVDGRRVHPARGRVSLLGRPEWREDGGAVAWLERKDGQVRLMVLPVVGVPSDPLPSAPLPWALPRLFGGDRLFWAGPTRVVVGPDLLRPRAIASWTL